MNLRDKGEKIIDYVSFGCDKSIYLEKVESFQGRKRFISSFLKPKDIMYNERVNVYFQRMYRA